jgi:aconitate hydratase
MIRGTFANPRIRNHLVSGEGGITIHLPDGEQMTIFDAAVRYQSEGVPLVVVAGKEYGSGSSRDWAAKGPALLGVRAVIAESFERIHRSNLIGMGVLPLQFAAGENAASLGLTGHESLEITGLSGASKGELVHRELTVAADGRQISVVLRVDTPGEADYLWHGGILPFVVRALAAV